MRPTASAFVLAASVAVSIAGCGAVQDTVTDSPAQATTTDRPRALARLSNPSGFALAGDSALLARVQDRVLEVKSHPSGRFRDCDEGV